ncbi:MAG: gliding motility-associated C-terminal domain-containing protein, partial [Marinilabiliales bacterium]|nr:gliding motility-associated C-terminal domain-containing protein [Marinilabiliales bacterium]
TPVPVLTNVPNLTICSGTSPNVALTASVPSSFSWKIGANPGGITGASAGFGATINQVLTNPSSTASGSIEYIVTPTATSGGCAGVPYTITLTVDPAPVVTTPASATICSGSSTGIVLNASMPSSFTWTVGAITGGITGASAGSGPAINQTLVNPSNTTSGTVTYLVTPQSSASSCVGTPYQIVVKVNPLPVLTSSLTPPAICSNTVFNYSPLASVAGTTFSWSRSAVAGIGNPAATGTGNPAEKLINTSSAPVSVTYVYTLTVNGCTSPVTYNVTVSVNPSALLTSPLNPGAICSGSGFSYIPTASLAGANITWSRALVAGISNPQATGSGAVNETLVNTTTAEVDVTYVFTLSTGSCVNVQNVVVPVNPLPLLSSSLSPPAVCNNSLFTYFPSSIMAGATFTWSRAAVAGISNAAAAGSGNVSETLINTTSQPVNVTYVYTIFANGCNNNQNVVVTVYPTPLMTSTLNPTPVCSGSVFSYVPTSSSAGVVFNWTRSAIAGITNPSASGTGNPNETLVNTSGLPLTVNYVYSLVFNGCLNPVTYTVGVVVYPATTLSSGLNPPPICSGTTFSYVPTSSTAGVTFNWNRVAKPGISNPAATGSGNPSEVLINTTNSPITVTYSYTLSANGCSTTQDVSVVVNPYPVLTSTLTPTGICSGSTFSYVPTSTIAGTTFAWNRPFVAGISNAPATGTGNPNEVLINSTGSPVQVTYIYALTSNGCTNPTTYNVVVMVNPTPSLSSTLTPNPICSNTTFSYTPASSNGLVIGWTRAAVAGISNPAASGVSNPNETLINTTSIPVLVTYAYTITSGGCTNVQNVVVTVNPAPILSSSLSPSAICSNGLFSYTPVSTTSGATFNWSRVTVAGISNPSASGTDNPNEVLVNTSPLVVSATYTYQVSANGCTTTSKVVVPVNPSPVLTSTLNPAPICSNSVFKYTPLSSTPNTTFNWSRAGVPGLANPAASGTGNPNETLVNMTASPITVTYLYTLSFSGCTSPVTYNVDVVVNPSATLTSSLNPGSICSGSIFNYVATSSTASAVLTWSRGNTSGIVQPAANGTGNISEFLTNSTASPIDVVYHYTLFLNGCSNTQDVKVTVNPSPDMTSSLSPPAICSGTMFNYQASSSTQGVTFTWTRAATAGILEPAASGTGNVNEILTNTSNAPVNVTYLYTLTANSCNNNSQFSVIVVVNPIPAVPVVTASGPTTFCQGDDVVLTAPAGYSYMWTNGATTRSTTVTTTGSFSVVVKDAIGCQSSPSLAIKTTALPAPNPPTSGGDITQCIDAVPQTLVPVATPAAGCILNWYDAPSGGTLLPAPSYTGLGTKVFYAESVNSLTGCTSLTRTPVTIKIISHPAAPVKDADITECEKSPLQTLTATATVPVGTTIKWFTKPTGGTAVAPTLNAVGTVSYYAEADNGICTSLSRTKVTLTINPAAATPVSLGNLSACDPTLLTAKSSDPAALWYLSPTGGSPVSPTLNQVGTATYYAESLLGTCPSVARSAGVVLTIFETPSAPVSGGDVVQCEQSPLQTLTATATAPAGCTVKWYLTATGGAPVANPTLNSPKSIIYYAESDNGHCVSSTRTAVKLQIDAAPKAPVAGKSITECQKFPTIQTLTATATASGSTILWYNTLAGGDPVSPTLNQVGTATYYAEASNGSCTSVTRSAPVTLTINPTPDSPVAIDVTECATKAAQVLTADVVAPPSGVNITWYRAATGGTAVSSPVLRTIGSIVYYAEAKLGNCVNPTRTPVTLTLNKETADPTLRVKGLDSLVACESAPIDTLDATTLFNVVPGVSIVCYDSQTGGAVVSPLLSYVGSRMVYAEAQSGTTHCPSLNRIPVKLVIHGAPPVPVSLGDLAECAQNPLQKLDANKRITTLPGYKIVWYNLPTGGSVVASPTFSKANADTTFFAENVDTTTGCKSLSRTAVKLSLSSSTASAASNSPVTLGQTLQLKGGPELPGATYLWTDPNGFVFNSMDVVIPNVTASAAGKYMLSVTAPNGCVAYDSTVVVIPIAQAQSQSPVCIGGTLYLSAKPDNMLSYAWSGPNGYTSTEQNPAINNVTLQMTGTYTLTVTDVNNATSSDTVNVAFKPLPIPIAEATTQCPSGNLQLKALPNGMSSYFWSFPSGSTSNLQNPPAMPYPNPEADITLTVVDWNGCQASKTIRPVPFQPTASSNSPVCTGDTLRLRGEPNGMISYLWSGPNNFRSNLQSPAILNANAATATGKYTLTVVTAAGCTATSSIDVTFNTPASVPTITPNMNPVCEGSTLILDGGPSGMASYVWSGPDGFASRVQSPQIAGMTAIKAGKYSLVVTNNTGCKNKFETNISVSTVTFNGTYGPYCTNDSPVTLSVSPGGGVFTGTGVTNNVFDPKAAGEGSHVVQYTYTPPGGYCSIIGTKVIDVVTIPNVVTNNQTLKSCTGSTVDLTLPAVTQGSTPGLIFNYFMDSKASVPLSTPKVVGMGTYYIRGATLSGKCFDIKPVKVMQPDSLRATLLIKATECYGDTTGSIQANVTLGTAPFNYAWSTIPIQSGSKATGLHAGVYTVVITDAKSCTVAITDTVKEAPAFKISKSKKDIDCLTDANGSAQIDSINHSGLPTDLNSYKYLWSTVPAQTTRQAVRLGYGYYYIKLTNDKGCSLRDSVFIDVKDTVPPVIQCPKSIDMIVHAVKTTDGSPNTVVVDLGHPVATDNCKVVKLTNDAPEKFRPGHTTVTWTATDQVGLVDTCKQEIYIKEFPTVPQLVSPNGDGINDFFVIEGLAPFPQSQLLIFTRSGQLVYQSNDYQNDWDGRYGASTFNKNKLVAPGVYYYILTLGGGSKQKVQGYVYIYY